MKLRKLALGFAAAPLLLAGCGDSNPFPAQLPTVEDVITVFALTGTPPAYPSGYNTFSRAATRVDGNANFDVAFDIDATGNAVIYPLKLIVSSIGGDRPVGVRKVAGTFASITEAPTGVYQQDSAVIAAKGDVIVIESNRGASSDICAFNISPNIYTKVLIDSVDTVTHTVTLQTVLDPNCGFRSFATGIPTK